MLTALAIAIALAAGLATRCGSNARNSSAGREVAQRIDTLSSDLAQARRDTREALALAQAQAGRLGELEDTVRETQSQYHALQQAGRTSTTAPATNCWPTMSNAC